MTGLRRWQVLALGAVALVAVPEGLVGQRFIEVSRQIQDIDSHFDDSILLQSPSLTVNIPALDRAEGIGFAFGGFGDRGGFSFYHTRTDVPTTSVLGDTIAAHRSYGLDFSLAPWLSTSGISVSPLFRFGMVYTTLNLPGEATDGVGLDDAGFGGIGFNAGIGGMLRLGGFGHVTADVSRRYLQFHDVSAFGDSTELADGLSATGDHITFAFAVYLPD